MDLTTPLGHKTLKSLIDVQEPDSESSSVVRRAYLFNVLCVSMHSI